MCVCVWACMRACMYIRMSVCVCVCVCVCVHGAVCGVADLCRNTLLWAILGVWVCVQYGYLVLSLEWLTFVGTHCCRVYQVYVCMCAVRVFGAVRGVADLCRNTLPWGQLENSRAEFPMAGHQGDG